MAQAAKLDMTAASAFGAAPWATGPLTPRQTEVIWVDEDNSVDEFLSEVPLCAVAVRDDSARASVVRSSGLPHESRRREVATAPVAKLEPARAAVTATDEVALAVRRARQAAAAELPFARRRWSIKISRTSWSVLLILGAVSLEGVYLGGHMLTQYGRAGARPDGLPPVALVSKSIAAAEPLLAVAGQPGLDLTAAAAPTPLDPAVPAATRFSSTPAPASVNPVASAMPVVGTPGSMGWVGIDVPFQVHVFERGRFVGTNAGDQLRLTAGTHELEIVNDALRFRAMLTLSVVAGKGTSVQVPLPTGLLSLNALPWSEVVIGGRVIGPTPLGRVQLPIGSHSIVFKHPELGEQTRTVVITAGSETRLTVDLRQ